MADALTTAGILSTLPRRDVIYDPTLRITYWNHTCPEPGCRTWVPHHRHACLLHEETP